jgi:thymidylate synthase (FAD)
MAFDDGTEHARLSVPAMDALLGKRFVVLDDGFVRVVDYMGGDASIVQAARVSYGEGTKRIHEDQGLIRYLMRLRHTTPFEMCALKLHIRAPMDVWRQWIRHRTASVNEYSTRYSIAINRAQATPPSAWRSQSKRNRQGSDVPLEDGLGKMLSNRERQLQLLAREVYEERLRLGVAREQARKDLTLSTYTEAYWKIDLHNLLHFLELRMDAHAQEEIREYAATIGEKIVAQWCPIAWRSFVDYRLRALALSGFEVELVGLLSNGDRASAVAALEAAGYMSRSADGRLRPHRERDELAAKLRRLGIDLPWPTTIPIVSQS